MTCIVGCQDALGYVLGGDMLSSCLDDGFKVQGAEKVIDGEGFSIGFCNSYKIQRYLLELIPNRLILCTQDVWDFTEDLEALLKEDVTDVSEENDFRDYPTELIVASSTGLWAVQTDLAVMPVKTFCAAGSGMYTAVGAMHYMSLYHKPLSALEQATRALRVSHETNIQVGDMFWFRSFTRK